MPQFRPHGTDPLLDIEPHYQLSLDGIADRNVGDIRRDAGDFLRTFGPTHVGRLSENDIFATTLCISEGVTNTIEERSGNISPTYLRMRLATGRIAVSIGDTGKYRKDLPHSHAQLPDNDAEDGRGFPLINDVTKGNFGFRTGTMTKLHNPSLRAILQITGHNSHPATRSRRAAIGKELWFIISTEPIEEVKPQ